MESDLTNTVNAQSPAEKKESRIASLCNKLAGKISEKNDFILEKNDFILETELKTLLNNYQIGCGTGLDINDFQAEGDDHDNIFVGLEFFLKVMNTYIYI